MSILRRSLRASARFRHPRGSADAVRTHSTISPSAHDAPSSTTPEQPGSTRRAVRIVEVSPRDGLQNEAVLLDAEQKARLIRELCTFGLRDIEAGSFVSPHVRQMANTREVLLHEHLQDLPSGSTTHSLSVLVPNMKGYAKLVDTVREGREAGKDMAAVREVAVFVSASEGFSRANLNMDIATSLEQAAQVAERARADGYRVRGYVSCVVGCPFGGSVASQSVSVVAKALWQIGCAEISLGDTIGVGLPSSIEAMLNSVARDVPIESLAGHCHDTYGTAIANVLHMARLGVRTFDSSIAGLGGCPFAPGASGNVATEDLVYALECDGYDTGLLEVGKEDREGVLDALVPFARTGEAISSVLGKPYGSRVGQVVLKRNAAKKGQ